MNNQLNIFDVMYPKYKITKPIRLIELFAGYGSQALALKYLGVEFEHWKICEWAIKSIQAYKDIHFEYDETYPPILKSQTKEEMVDYLYKKGISSNYNEPMTRKQIDRLSEKQLKNILNNIYQTHNLVNIQQVKGKDLEIIDTDKYDYIMTYSFPCQDLSNAGKKAGFNDTSTRSGMLWEVERILNECKEDGNLPQILLMENVIQLHSLGENMNNFYKWQLKLEELGYKNYWQDLIATDYGIPQTRNRCFMVSILGDYSYTFSQPIPLELKLKDMLEDNVDEKYYLSDKMIKYITSNDDKYKVNENNLVINRNVACTKTTREGNTRADTSDYICRKLSENYNIKNNCKQIYNLNYYNHEQSNRVYSPEYSSPTLRTKYDEAGAIKIEIGNLKIKNATKQGYLEATDGDGIDLSMPNSKTRRGRVQKEAIQTLTTQNNLGVCVETIKNEDNRKLLNIASDELIKTGKVKENDVLLTNFITRRIKEDDLIQNNNISPTLTTSATEIGVCVGTYQYSKSDNFMKGKDRLQLGKEVSDTLQTTQKEGVVTIGNYSPSNHNASRIVNQEHSAPTVMENHETVTATQTSDLRIRKLTPRECFRLMGVKDEDFEKCAKNQSDSSLYHLAGDSIVVNVLMTIFREMIK